MKITTMGIDLAKQVFQVHGVDARGKAALKKPLKRDQVSTFFSNLGPCLVGMEACGSAHHGARKLQAMGHTVKLMAPPFVKPEETTGRTTDRHRSPRSRTRRIKTRTDLTKEALH